MKGINYMTNTGMSPQVAFFFASSLESHEQPALFYLISGLPKPVTIFLSLGLIYFEPQKTYQTIMNVYVDGKCEIADFKSSFSTPPLSNPDLRIKKESLVFALSTPPIELPSRISFVRVQLSILYPDNNDTLSTVQTWIQSVPSEFPLSNKSMKKSNQ